MTTQHTPTPYRIGLKPGPMLYAQDGEQIADCTFENGGNNKANAEFIVRACNAYDELVQAVEDALLIADLHDFEGAAIENYKRVLKKAKGEI